MNKKTRNKKKDNHCHNKYNCPGERKREEYLSSVKVIKTEEEVEVKTEEEIINELKEEILKSMTYIAIIAFLWQNECFMDTAKNLADHIKLTNQIKGDESLVKEILDNLVKKTIMEKIGEGESAIYILNDNMKFELQQRFKDLFREISKQKV